MATTGWTFKGKFYPYGSKLPDELLEVLRERGLDPKTGQRVKKVPARVKAYEIKSQALRVPGEGQVQAAGKPGSSKGKTKR